MKRKEFPAISGLATRCDRGPVAVRFGCGRAARSPKPISQPGRGEDDEKEPGRERVGEEARAVAPPAPPVAVTRDDGDVERRPGGREEEERIAPQAA